MRRAKRNLFLLDMTENILRPYDASKLYEEEIVGEFENKLENEYFVCFTSRVGKGGLVLDLACGDGRHTLALSNEIGRVVALDLSPNNLKMAKNKCSRREDVAFIRGSMFQLPLRESRFDGVWFSQAFEYVAPDGRESFLASLKLIAKSPCTIYMSVETWMYPSVKASLVQFLGDAMLFCYWRFLKGKPPLWGEFMYNLSSTDLRDTISGWHYHVHTDKWTLERLFRRTGYPVLMLALSDGYIYVLCRTAVRARAEFCRYSFCLNYAVSQVLWQLHLGKPPCQARRTLCVSH